MKGGYQIIDLKGADLNTETPTVKGAYVKATAGKAILFENILSGTVKIGGAFAYAQVMEDGSVKIPFTISTDSAAVNAYISVSDEDVVALHLYEGE